MATKQDIERLALSLATYMETCDGHDWERWIADFKSTPMVKLEYAKVREMAKEIVEKRNSPVMRELKGSK